MLCLPSELGLSDDNERYYGVCPNPNPLRLAKIFREFLGFLDDHQIIDGDFNAPNRT